MSDQALPTREELKAQKAKRDQPKWEEDVPVIAVVENAGKESADDSKFWTEVRILTGPRRGDTEKITWFRHWPSGDFREDTAELLYMAKEDGSPDKAPVWSYMLAEKEVCFQFTPVKKVVEGRDGKSRTFWNFNNVQPAEPPAEDRQDYQGNGKAPPLLR